MMISQVAKRYKAIKFSWKFSAKILTFVAVVYFISSYVINQIHFDRWFLIHDVRIAGVLHTDHSEVQELLHPLVSKGFFAIDVPQIKQRLLQLPWISEVSVKRVWPETIDIQVYEKTSLATWNDIGLISTTGEIFNPPKESYPPHLPRFLGPTGSQIQMLNYFDIISSIIEPLQFKIAEIEFSDEQGFRIAFANGIKLNLGYKDVLTRLGHFVKVYPKIIGNRASEVEYVDLRYSNGLAVRWKT